MKLLSVIIGRQAIWTERTAKSEAQMFLAIVKSHKQQVLKELASQGPLCSLLTFIIEHFSEVPSRNSYIIIVERINQGHAIANYLPRY